MMATGVDLHLGVRSEAPVVEDGATATCPAPIIILNKVKFTQLF